MLFGLFLKTWNILARILNRCVVVNLVPMAVRSFPFFFLFFFWKKRIRSPGNEVDMESTVDDMKNMKKISVKISNIWTTDYDCHLN